MTAAFVASVVFQAKDIDAAQDKLEQMIAVVCDYRGVHPNHECDFEMGSLRAEQDFEDTDSNNGITDAPS